MEVLNKRQYHKKFCALKDISFNLNSGESLGIIGDNGAGKSTLLKILARTLSFSSGEIAIHGKVAALLELGAGFHTEFTGRQNIFLNASLQGLREEVIRDREEEIIRFSGLDQFIDQPIKTYSSGMIVRLAFSIATCVDPDILIVDEALSVGDYSFQQKCIKKMVEFIENEKTIIFCSHSMYLVNKLCDKAMWLQEGSIKCFDSTSNVVSEYLAYQESIHSTRDANHGDYELNGSTSDGASCSPEVMISNIKLLNDKNEELLFIQQFQEVRIEIDLKQVLTPMYGHLAAIIENEDGKNIFSTVSTQTFEKPLWCADFMKCKLILPSIPLQSGRYKVHAILSDEHALQIVHEYSTELYTVVSTNPEYGMFYIDHHWKQCQKF